jgi:hypothetical protein
MPFSKRSIFGDRVDGSSFKVELFALHYVNNHVHDGMAAGLPDGFFSNQKSKFGKILEVLGWENVDIF